VAGDDVRANRDRLGRVDTCGQSVVDELERGFDRDRPASRSAQDLANGLDGLVIGAY